MASSSVSTGNSQQSSQQSAQSASSSFIPDFSQTPILEQIAQYAEGMAPQLYTWGQGVYAQNQGLVDQFINQANQYADPAFQAADMGRAGAGVAQGYESQRQAALRDLESYGIDPSSGRYAELDQANRVQAGAAVAGAENQQQLADTQQSIALRNEGMNASLANAASGAQLMGLPNQYLGTAIRLPYSPLGNQSQSASQGTSAGSSQQDSVSFSDNAGSGGGGGGSSGGGTSGLGSSNRGGGGEGGGGSSGPGDPGAPAYQSPGGGAYGGGYGGSATQYSNPYYGGGTDPGGGGYGGDSGYQGPSDTQGDSGYEGFSSYGEYQGPSDVYGDSGYGGDYYGDSGYGGDYAEGGEVDDEGGGFVPQDMSPSGGQQTDDIPAVINQTGGQAHLNSDEFVIPRDVALWKGQEFFQNLIEKSRQARTQAPARPQAG